MNIDLIELARMAALASQRAVADHARFITENARYAGLIEALETRHRSGALFGDLWAAMRDTYRYLGNHPFSHAYQVRSGCDDETEHALSRLCHAADKDDVNLMALLALKQIGDHPKGGQKFVALVDNLPAVIEGIKAEKAKAKARSFGIHPGQRYRMEDVTHRHHGMILTVFEVRNGIVRFSDPPTEGFGVMVAFFQQHWRLVT